MASYPKLNLPPVKLRASRHEGIDHVWDELRGCWLVLTPEEWVRRHVIGWLLSEQGVEPAVIMQEYPVSIEGMAQRADIVVADNLQRPLLLVECKCVDVRIDGLVLDQAVRYNKVVGARYIMLTNGLRHYFYATYDGTSYVPLKEVPSLRSGI